MKLSNVINGLLCGAACVASAGVMAQGADYPSRPVRQVIPFAPGGASDYVGRIIAVPLGKLLKQQIISDNRPGAAGNIGMEYAARATPDGYTLYQGNVGTLTINPNIYKALPVKPLQDFAPITQVVDVPGSLVIHPSLPVKSVAELIKFAKARPGQLNFGSPGAGSANRLEMENFMLDTGIKMVHIPYKGGAGPAAIGLISGETQLMFVTLSSAVTFIQSGKLRALGVVAPKRVAAVPNIPTMAEQGFKTMTVGSWQGLLAPAGTPKPIIDKLYAAIIKVMDMPEVKNNLAKGGVAVVTSKSPEDFHEFMKQDTARWAKVVKATGITVD
jgi:tripartite-type tricarboxylate transporter receptor subunit TctC